MKVKELIEMLEDYDGEQEVYFAYTSSDYWRTVVAEPVREAEEAALEPSDYHGQGMMRVVEDNDENRDVYPVILSSGPVVR